jgi:hypothetical protein
MKKYIKPFDEFINEDFLNEGLVNDAMKAWKTIYSYWNSIVTLMASPATTLFYSFIFMLMKDVNIPMKEIFKILIAMGKNNPEYIGDDPQNRSLFTGVLRIPTLIKLDIDYLNWLNSNKKIDKSVSQESFNKIIEKLTELQKFTDKTFLNKVDKFTKQMTDKLNIKED